MQEKKRLEDALMELRLQNDHLQQGGSADYYGEGPPMLSEESRAVMREMDAPEDSKPLFRQLSDTRQELQRLTEEVSPLFYSMNTPYCKLQHMCFTSFHKHILHKDTHNISTELVAPKAVFSVQVSFMSTVVNIEERLIQARQGSLVSEACL